MSKLAAFNLMGWIEDNRRLLTPPMLNKPIWRDGEFIVMILAGPVLRADYHVNPREEFFYQLRGNMTLKTVEDGVPRDVPIDEGGVLLLPPLVPHSPQRPEPGSIGLVVELARRDDEFDGFEWYCANCAACVYRGDLHLKNLATDRAKLFETYYGSVAKDNCPNCGHENPQPADA